MKNMLTGPERMLLALALCGCMQVGHTQELDTVVLKKFDPAIVMKVYGIARQTNLTGAQQAYLANYYRLSDSIAKAWIMQGRPAAQIDSLQEKESQFFYNMNGVDPRKKMAFAQKNASAFAEVASQGEMDYINSEYRPGPDETKLIGQWVNAKYNFIYQRYLMNGKDAFSSRQSAQLYDLYNFYPALYAGKFINDYLVKLDGIRSIGDSNRIRIRFAFLNAIKRNKYADWSRILLEITRAVLPDTALFSRLYRDDLEREAIAKTAIDRYQLFNVEHISREAFDGVYSLVLGKNYTNALLEYAYGVNNTRMVDSLVNHVSRHYDSAITAALIRDGSMQPSSQFALALKYKNNLGFSPAIVDTLVFQAMYLIRLRDSAQLIEPFNAVDYGDYEAKVLSTLLTDQQYTDLLTIRNKPAAYDQAKKDWADLVKFNLAAGLDKDQTIDLMADYYINRYSAWNRLAYDTKRQVAGMRAIEEIKPPVLKTLDQVRWNAQDDKSNPSAGSTKLQW